MKFIEDVREWAVERNYRPGMFPIESHYTSVKLQLGKKFTLRYRDYQGIDQVLVTKDLAEFRKAYQGRKGLISFTS